MDFELHTRVNEIIYDLTNRLKEEFNAIIDSVWYQTDKYESTIYETITIGLGTTKGLKKDKYLFNALERDDCPNTVDPREPVNYYAHHTECNLFYIIEVSPYSRIIKTYEVGYTTRYTPVYNLIKTVNLGASKLMKKYVPYTEA